jgi:hypothetical protein
VEKLLGKEERQKEIEDKLTVKIVEENLKNLASVLKPILDCGNCNNGVIVYVTIAHVASLE